MGIEKVGEVVGLYVKEKKDSHIRLIEEGFFEKDKGLVGDIHFNNGNGQVTIFTAEGREEILSSSLKGLYTSRFYENIRIRSLEVEKLKVGSSIKIGNTIQEIIRIGKKCFPECEIVKKGSTCPLSTLVIFTRIVEGGSVMIGDRVYRKS